MQRPIPLVVAAVTVAAIAFLGLELHLSSPRVKPVQATAAASVTDKQTETVAHVPETTGETTAAPTLPTRSEPQPAATPAPQQQLQASGLPLGVSPNAVGVITESCG